VVKFKHLVLWKHTTAKHIKSTQTQQPLSAPLLLLLVLHAKCFGQTAHMAMIYLSIRMRYKLTLHSIKVPSTAHLQHIIATARTPFCINVYMCMHTVGWQDQQCGVQCLHISHKIVCSVHTSLVTNVSLCVQKVAGMATTFRNTYVLFTYVKMAKV